MNDNFYSQQQRHYSNIQLPHSLAPVAQAGQLPQRFRPYPSAIHHVTKGRYITSNDPRGYIPVYEYPLNGQWIMMDVDDGYILWTGIWKALGNAKADIVKMIESQPELAPLLRRVRGGYLKIQGTWMPYDVAVKLSRRVAWPIRDDLVPFFGPDFPETCLSPDQPGYGQVIPNASGRRKGRRNHAMHQQNQQRNFSQVAHPLHRQQPNTLQSSALPSLNNSGPHSSHYSHVPQQHNLGGHVGVPHHDYAAADSYTISQHSGFGSEVPSPTTLHSHGYDHFRPPTSNSVAHQDNQSPFPNVYHEPGTTANIHFSQNQDASRDQYYSVNHAYNYSPTREAPAEAHTGTGLDPLQHNPAAYMLGPGGPPNRSDRNSASRTHRYNPYPTHPHANAYPTSVLSDTAALDTSYATRNFHYSGTHEAPALISPSQEHANHYLSRTPAPSEGSTSHANHHDGLSGTTTAYTRGLPTDLTAGRELPSLQSSGGHPEGPHKDFSDAYSLPPISSLEPAHTLQQGDSTAVLKRLRTENHNAAPIQDTQRPSHGGEASHIQSGASEGHRWVASGMSVSQSPGRVYDAARGSHSNTKADGSWGPTMQHSSSDFLATGRASTYVPNYGRSGQHSDSNSPGNSWSSDSIPERHVEGPDAVEGQRVRARGMLSAGTTTDTITRPRHQSLSPASGSNYHSSERSLSLEYLDPTQHPRSAFTRLDAKDGDGDCPGTSTRLRKDMTPSQW